MRKLGWNFEGDSTVEKEHMWAGLQPGQDNLFLRVLPAVLFLDPDARNLVAPYLLLDAGSGEQSCHCGAKR